jgi:Cys-tRNA(Pro)/Cys-tRNA(Cys) deacylase
MTPAVRAALDAGIPFRLVEFEARTGESYGAHAATALGLPPEHVFKTLIAKLDGRQLVVALVPVSAELDLKALAELAGAKRAAMATPQEAERSTGYVRGGISPVGQRRRLATYLDSSVTRLSKVYVSGGRRGLELELAPNDLIDVCRGHLGTIAR